MFAPGSTITNGHSAVRLVMVYPDMAGGRFIALNADESPSTGSPVMVPVGLLKSWRHVAFEWRPVAGEPLEERYRWSPDHRWLQRETRLAASVGHPDARGLCRVMPTVNGIRGHRVHTPEENERARRTYVSMTVDPAYVAQVMHLLNEPRS